jgi:hypothetical protein
MSQEPIQQVAKMEIKRLILSPRFTNSRYSYYILPILRQIYKHLSPRYHPVQRGIQSPGTESKRQL